MRSREASDAVDRLYERLVLALQQSRRDPFTVPVTVAEIYQELVPYRSMREQVGFGMNADYEHALLRLLAGDGDWVQLEPASARDIILRELNSPNPNVSIYREYAGCDAWVKAPPPGAMPHAIDSAAPVEDEDLDWLTSLEDEDASTTPANAQPQASPAKPASGAFSFAELVDLEDELDDAPPRPQAMPEAASPAPPAPAADRESGTVPSSRPASGGLPDSAAPVRDPAGSGPSLTRAGGQAPSIQAARCVFCDSSLPTGRKIRFCPFCGGDQQMRPCASCGETLEGGWSFCVACGTPAADD